MPATAQQRPTSLKGIQGAERVAAILLTMGKSLSARVMKHFDPEEIKRITRSAADLRPVPAQALSVLIEEFATQFAIGASLVSSPSEVERMLDGVLPKDQISEILAELAGNPGRTIWERISAINEKALATHLQGEHPQTAALILSRVKPSAAAKVLGFMPPAVRDGVIRRMINIKPPVDETMRLLERILDHEFTVNFARDAGSEGQAHLADIINRLEQEQIEDVLKSLSATSPKAAEALKSRLFTFEDLAKLSTRARGTLFDKVPRRQDVGGAEGGAGGAEGDGPLFALVTGAQDDRARALQRSSAAGPATFPRHAGRSPTWRSRWPARGEIEIRADSEDYVS